MARKKPADVRQALEEALVADPDDLPAHMAYADYLTEQGDARGEFVRVQLALEDESLPAAERQRLQRREAELLEAHQRDWLGELAPFLLDDRTPQDWGSFVVGEAPVAGGRFRRGWLDVLHVNELDLEFARALQVAPAARLLRDLVIETIQDTVGPDPIPSDRIPAGERWPGLHPLRGATTLANVRHFRLGPDQGDDYRQFRCYVKSRVTAEIVGLMPRLEELYLWCNEFNLNDLFALPTLGNLRVLLVYHGEQLHRLQALDRPAFRNLTHLLIHPHHVAYGTSWDEDVAAAGYNDQQEGYLPLSVVLPVLRSTHLARLTHLRLRCSSMGDEGCAEIVRSGILKRLRVLDLRHGCVTDAGARTLADCPDLRQLDLLDLNRNGLRPEGIARLEAVGIAVRCDDQQADEELHPQEDDLPPQYLCEGEFE